MIINCRNQNPADPAARDLSIVFPIDRHRYALPDIQLVSSRSARQTCQTGREPNNHRYLWPRQSLIEIYLIFYAQFPLSLQLVKICDDFVMKLQFS
jgi:hypothetical protein